MNGSAHEPEGLDIAQKVFPAAKPIETRAQRRERIAKSQREEITAKRRYINDRERELGMELTKW